MVFGFSCLCCFCNLVEIIFFGAGAFIQNFPILLLRFFLILIKKGGGSWPCETLATLPPSGKGATSIPTESRIDKVDFSCCNYFLRAGTAPYLAYIFPALLSRPFPLMRIKRSASNLKT